MESIILRARQVARWACIATTETLNEDRSGEIPAESYSRDGGGRPDHQVLMSPLYVERAVGEAWRLLKGHLKIIRYETNMQVLRRS